MTVHDLQPVRPDLVAVTVSGHREAVDDWIDLLDSMPGWRPATTWATDYDNDLGTETIYVLMGPDTDMDLGPCPCPGTPTAGLAATNRTNPESRLVQ